MATANTGSTENLEGSNDLMILVQMELGGVVLFAFVSLVCAQCQVFLVKPLYIFTTPRPPVISKRTSWLRHLANTYPGGSLVWIV